MEIKPISNLPGHGTHNHRQAWPQAAGGGLHLGDPDRHNKHALPNPIIVIRGDAVVESARDVFFFGVIGGSGRTVTVTFNPSLMIDAGCFHGTLDAFAAEVALKEEGSRDRVEYEAAIEMIKVLAGTRCK